MSRIGTVRPNYQQNIMQKPKVAPRSQSFTGSLPKPVQDKVFDLLIGKHKFLHKLTLTAGEIQNIIFIGLGTAFVAPIFIAYNPLSKQDEKTKKYSALRQPLSAIISTVTGLAINIPVGNAFNTMAAEGKHLQKFNMEAKPPSDFLRNRYNSIIKNFSKLNERDQKYFDMVNDGSIKDVNAFKKKYRSFQEFITGVHAVSQNNAAQKLLDPNNHVNGLRNTTLKDFLVKNLGVKQHPIERNQLNPDYIEKSLKNTSAVGFLKDLGVDVDENTVRTFLGKNFYKEKFDAEILKNQDLAGEIFKIIKKNSKQEDFAGLNEEKLEKLFKDSLSKRGFSEDERKTISRLSELWVDEKSKGTEKISVKTLFKVLGIEEDFYKHKCLNSKMDKFLLWIDKNLTHGVPSELSKNNAVKKNAKQLEVEALENGKKLVKFAGQIATNAVQKAESDFKAYSKAQGIVLSLLILPFACGALNWSYPRIMEKCFPGLSGTKVDNKPDKKAGK